MVGRAEIDVQAAHKYFAVECFNRAWELIDMPYRSSQQEQQMLLLGLSSLWHWTRRQDCTSTNLSIGYWQVARIFALLGQGDNARSYAQLCLKVSREAGVPPFYLGYAYEALARAEKVAGNLHRMNEYLIEARAVAGSLPDPDSKKALLADLGTISQPDH